MDNNNVLPQISASKIKTYRSCAKKYEYSYINKPTAQENKEERNVGALLGTVLHRIIEARYKDPSINPMSLYQEKMLGLLEEWQALGYTILGEQYFSKQFKEGREILEKFNWDLFRPVELEKYFSVLFPSVDAPIAKLIGYIDLIDENTSVIDHKSQRKLPAADELANDAQMIIYRFAYKQMYGDWPYKVVWHNLRSGELIDTHVEDNYDEKFAQLVSDITAMLSATQYSRINLSDTCRKECGFYKLCWGGDGGSTL